MELKINHRIKNGIVDVFYFNNFEVNLVFDSLASTFSFDFLFDPYNKEHAELACVSHFHDCELKHNGATLITGRLLNQGFNESAVPEFSSFSGYSTPGTFEDCQIPPDLYPLQSDGLSVADIARKIANRFGIKVVIDPAVASDMGKAITKSTAEPTQTIKDYLTELTKQRHIVMTHDEKGNLFFTKAKMDLKPILDLSDGMPGVDMKLNFNGQGIHSHITVMKQASSKGGNAGQYTIQNPFCPVRKIYRPKVVTQTSGDDITIEETAKQELAAELKNIPLIVNLDRWELDSGIVRPNNTITVFSPKNYIFKKTKFFIERVNLKGDGKSTVAQLTCVLPEVYNGQVPKNIFVDSHDNYPRFDYPKQK